MKHPCVKDCPERSATCKKTCEKLKEYTAWKKPKDEEKIRQYKINQYQIDQIIRRKK